MDIQQEMRALFLFFCVCAEIHLITLVAASLQRRPSEVLKLRVTVECLLMTAPPAIPALREVCISRWLGGAQDWLLLSGLRLCCHLHLSLWSLDGSTVCCKAVAKSQALWGVLFDKVHSSATAPVCRNKVTGLVYTVSLLLLYCGSIICPLGTAPTIFSADTSCSRLPFRR